MQQVRAALAADAHHIGTASLVNYASAPLGAKKYDGSTFGS
jgi:hypothetical protein